MGKCFISTGVAPFPPTLPAMLPAKEARSTVTLRAKQALDWSKLQNRMHVMPHATGNLLAARTGDVSVRSQLTLIPANAGMATFLLLYPRDNWEQSVLSANLRWRAFLSIHSVPTTVAVQNASPYSMRLYVATVGVTSPCPAVQSQLGQAIASLR